MDIVKQNGAVESAALNPILQEDIVDNNITLKEVQYRITYAGHIKEILWDDVRSYTWSCLLYTSPSPRDGLLSRMPSSA